MRSLAAVVLGCVLLHGAQARGSLRQNRNRAASSEKPITYFTRGTGIRVHEDLHAFKCDAGKLLEREEARTDHLPAGEILPQRRWLYANGITLRMQQDCNLVIQRDDQPIFSSYTSEIASKCALVITGDECSTRGDLAIVDTETGQYIWRVASSVLGPGADMLKLQKDGNLVLFLQGGHIVWTSDTAGATEENKDDKGFGKRATLLSLALYQDDSIHSCNVQGMKKRYWANMKNFLGQGWILHQGEKLTDDYGYQGSFDLVVQHDCNLVFYDYWGKVRFSSNTPGKAKKCALIITGDDCTHAGDLALIDLDTGKYVWAALTSFARTAKLRLQVTKQLAFMSEMPNGDHAILWTTMDRYQETGRKYVGPLDGDLVAQYIF